MTVEQYLAYVRDYERQVFDAIVLARHGLADPTPEEESLALYGEEDPFTLGPGLAFVLLLEAVHHLAEARRKAYP